MGFIISKTIDLNENMLLQELEYDYNNAIKWVDSKYNLEDPTDLHEMCVVRETIKKISDCLRYKIPLRILLNKTFDYNIEGNIIPIYDIKQNTIKYTDTLWLDIFKDELTRKIQAMPIGDAIEMLMENKSLFIKSTQKAFSRIYNINDYNDYDVLEALKDSYGRHWYAFEDLGISGATIDELQRIKGIIGEKEYTKLAMHCILTSLYGSHANKVIVSEIRPFAIENEFRCIFVEDKIHSISERVDYKCFLKRTNKEHRLIREYCDYLISKYYDKVPYKIWNVDLCIVDGKIEIVEAHLHCGNLGHFLYNQDYNRYIELLNKKNNKNA